MSRPQTDSYFPLINVCGPHITVSLGNACVLSFARFHVAGSGCRSQERCELQPAALLTSGGYRGHDLKPSKSPTRNGGCDEDCCVAAGLKPFVYL
mmetsp:Transcript_80230/g.134096  ORF Transcript_80230/g.134096 Transcript_80230/m.134096 type:complete len:95 (+) Transcript_80230:136-420(+)